VVRLFRLVLTDSVAPICYDSRTGDRAIDAEYNPFNTIWGGGGVDKVEPVFTDHPRVGRFIVVVGRYIIVTPAAPIISTVGASLGQGMLEFRILGERWRGGYSRCQEQRAQEARENHGVRHPKE
jgi:hypothetical protein